MNLPSVRAMRNLISGLLLTPALLLVGTAHAGGDVLVPAAVPGVQATAKVATGASHTVALQADGTVLSWGGNAAGQLGDGTTSDRISAKPVTGLNGVSAIATGHNANLALRNDGTVWTWGQFQSGSASDSVKALPQQVAGLGAVTRIAVGKTHALALKADGTVWAWGLNVFGEVGDGTKTARPLPVQVFSGATAVAAGDLQSMAVGADSRVRVWGSNAQGALGLGSSVVEALVPTALDLSVGPPSPPANDDFANRIAITGASGTVGGTLVGATREVSEPAEGGSSASISIWYRWTAPASGQVTLNTAGSVAVGAEAYVGNSVSALTLAGRGTFQATAGQQYAVVLYNTAGSFGTAVLNWSMSTGSSADLSITVGVQPSPAYVDSTLTYLVSVSNAGPDDATSVIVSGSVPSGAQLDVASLPASCSFQAPTITCSLGTIASGGSTSLDIAMRPRSAPQTIINSLSVTSQVADPATANNTATVSVAVLTGSGGTTSGGQDDIPTAPQWALLLLASLLMAFMARSKHRR